MPDPLPERFDDGDLVLRRWQVSDAARPQDVITANIDHLRPWMPWIAFEPRSVEQRAELIAGWERDWEHGGDVVLGVFLNGVTVGSIGLHRRLGPDGLEIGYWIDQAHTGRGLATRVAGLLTTGAFAIDGITHVEIHCDRANLASARVPEKLGFRYVGEVTGPDGAPSETGVQQGYRLERVGADGGLTARWFGASRTFGVLSRNYRPAAESPPNANLDRPCLVETNCRPVDELCA